MNLNDLAKKVNENSISKGLWPEDEIIDTIRHDADENLIDDESLENIKNAFIVQRLSLVISELTEAVESLRENKKANYKEYSKAIGQFVDEEFTDVMPALYEKHIKDSFEDEIVDAMIRLLDVAGGYHIDLDRHMTLKMVYNSTRPYQHGKKF